MRRNVEVKARLRARAAARDAAQRLGEAAQAQGQGRVLAQADTFFRVPRGRLKLRRTAVSAGLGVGLGWGPWGVLGPWEGAAVGLACLVLTLTPALTLTPDPA